MAGRPYVNVCQVERPSEHQSLHSAAATHGRMLSKNLLIFDSWFARVREELNWYRWAPIYTTTFIFEINIQSLSLPPPAFRPLRSSPYLARSRPASHSNPLGRNPLESKFESMTFEWRNRTEPERRDEIFDLRTPVDGSTLSCNAECQQWVN